MLRREAHSFAIKFNKIQADKQIRNVQHCVFYASAVLDSQLLFSGQPVQAMINHSALRRGEGEAIISSTPKPIAVIQEDHFRRGLAIGELAENYPPLGHALRDFRLATIFPPEDASPFIWRSIESILWDLKPPDFDDASRKSNIDYVSNLLSFDSKLISEIKMRVKSVF